MAKTLFAPPKKEEGQNHYTTKIAIPQYVPNKQQPPITGLYNCEKYAKLVYDINHSNVTDEEKKYLKFAAARHIVFNYALAADYYANAGPEMQKLMEDSALVILDVEDAIAKGYVKLSKDIDKLLEDSGAQTGG